MAIARLNIAVTDRNPHVREFLCRELSGLGYAANAVGGAGDLLELLAGPQPPQALVLDPEALGPRLDEVLRRLEPLRGRLTVLLHVYEGAEPLPVVHGALVIEKQPHMGALKTALSALTGKSGGCAATEGLAGAGRTQERR